VLVVNVQLPFLKSRTCSADEAPTAHCHLLTINPVMLISTLLDATGRPTFSALQNGAASAAIVYYMFDVMITREVLPLLAEPVREAPRFDASLADLIAAVRAQGLEGVVAKRLNSIYELGARSGAWRKMRLNRAAEFAIGGYTVGGRPFDALVLGRYDGRRLVYVARTRVGFTPASRERLMAELRPLEIAKCPFANLPEARSGRWGEGLTAEKMKECVRVRPELVAVVEFVEWTPDGHLRHSVRGDEGAERGTERSRH
jgi:ATP-dependent DNA ligase